MQSQYKIEWFLEIQMHDKSNPELWCLEENNFRWNEWSDQCWCWRTFVPAFPLGPLLHVSRKCVVLKLWKDFYLIVTKDSNAFFLCKAITCSEKQDILPWTFLEGGKKIKQTQQTNKTNCSSVMFFLSRLSFEALVSYIWIIIATNN